MSETIDFSSEPGSTLTVNSSGTSWVSTGATLGGGTIYTPSYSYGNYTTSWIPNREVKIVVDLSNAMSDSEYTTKVASLLKTIEDLNWNIKKFKVKR